MDYKEYSRMRDIAMKRIDRLQNAGVNIHKNFPKVSKIKSDETLRESKEEIFDNLRKFLQSGITAGNYRKSQRLAMQSAINPEREKKYTAYLKGLYTLGIHIPPEKLGSFFAYMDYRFSQGVSSYKYAFATFSEDYEELVSKGYRPDQIIDDYQKFVADQDDLRYKSEKRKGVPRTKVRKSWVQFKVVSVGE